MTSDEGLRDRLPFVQSIYSNLENQIARADTKAGLLLATHGFLGISVASPMVSLFPRLVTTGDTGAASLDMDRFVPTAIFALVFLTAFSISLWRTTVVLWARVTDNTGDGHRSLLFFEHIKSLGSNLEERHRNYVDALSGRSTADLVEDYAWTNCSLAAIVSKKMHCINVATKAFRRTVLAWLLILLWLTLLFPVAAAL